MEMVFSLCTLGAVQPCAYWKFLYLTDIKLYVTVTQYRRRDSYRYIDRNLP